LLLYESHKQKAPEMAADLIIDRIGESGSRLREMFKRHRAWGKVIVMTRPAYYRPNLP